MTKNSHGKIMVVAKRLISHKGYCNTSISDIAKGCALQKASIYHHFDSKEAIATAILNSCVDELAVIKPFDAGQLKHKALEDHINSNLLCLCQLSFELQNTETLLPAVARYKAHLQQALGEYLACANNHSKSLSLQSTSDSFAILAKTMIVEMMGQICWQSPVWQPPVLKLAIPVISPVATH